MEVQEQSTEESTEKKTKGTVDVHGVRDGTRRPVELAETRTSDSAWTFEWTSVRDGHQATRSGGRSPRQRSHRQVSREQSQHWIDAAGPAPEQVAVCVDDRSPLIETELAGKKLWAFGPWVHAIFC